ncbi:hypothetical protein CWI42_121510 [Ordospora colligata]|uniref:Uncharacterized protein n=1 Tax=Ordospora colligata OC4 TaxID=1354746 RepID=A0A0B2UHV9_9MICR|nr:uncharacterized protein M896_121510 [Ordospora colligata OC4]KHN68928.1 hypothetical protein M896_121510 [Ordospora colligata OC4]TBU13962.1 hypothetical protein CWI40_121510 [Ordospora colligata]TBU14151.1 hypothetical protein CWI41_121510 [Ordospora colligata]TBU17820.1 hypothetical protein CWI42_121510 [Ordospora colligata]
MNGTGSPVQVSYFITTRQCVIPHVIWPWKFPSFCKGIKVYTDDILYKDSAYDKGLEQTIREFCSIDSGSVCVGFRGKSKTLTSKRGNYKLEKKRYEMLIDTLEPDFSANYADGKMIIDGNELVEPANVSEFVYMLNSGIMLFGTEFVNRAVDEGHMLKFDGKIVSEGGVFDCKCCGELCEGYLEYLWNIKEMNAMRYLTIHNYNVINSVIGTICSEDVQDRTIVYSNEIGL